MAPTLPGERKPEELFIPPTYTPEVNMVHYNTGSVIKYGNHIVCVCVFFCSLQLCNSALFFLLLVVERHRFLFKSIIKANMLPQNASSFCLANSSSVMVSAAVSW